MLARERGRALHWAARMALRLDDAEALDRLIAAHRETRTSAASGAVAARDRWVDGLGGDLAAVEAAAEELEALGYRFSAADAWADAGVMAERSGAGERAASGLLSSTPRWASSHRWATRSAGASLALRGLVASPAAT